MEKLKELLLGLGNIGEFSLDKFNDLFPPETRDEKLHQWLKIGAPFLIGGIFLILLCCCCRRCCCGRSTRMMVAPGRRPLRMPRNGRDHDPDCEPVERRKLNKLLKREAKGAARELWKDNHFLYEAKQREKAMLDEEKAEMYGKAKAFLQEQEHAFKSGQWGKGRKRRR
ncbi:Nucleolar protein 14 [Dillenia turbinata]|uniref:Nucleolar protein 14 n=1 Tax=Dillenia turbinata TaxID=194707 RepID=A0AAN8VCB9_9MAGN